MGATKSHRFVLVVRKFLAAQSAQRCRIILYYTSLVVIAFPHWYFIPLFLFRSLPLGFSGQARTPLWPPGCSRRSRARAAEGGNPVGPLLHTSLKAAPGGDSPLSGCPLQAGFTGALVCPVKGVTPRAPLSPSRVAAISLRHQGGYPSLWNGFIRSSLPSHSQPSTLKDTAVSKQVRTDPGLAKRVCPGVDTALQ